MTDDEVRTRYVPPVPRTSRTALVLALCYWVPLLLGVGILRFVVSTSGSTTPTESTPFYGVIMTAAILVIYVIPILGAVGGLTGTLLGIVGITTSVREEEHRLFAIVGTALAALALVFGSLQLGMGSAWLVGA